MQKDVDKIWGIIQTTRNNLIYICNEINNKRKKLRLYFDKSYANIDIIKLSLDKLIQEFIHGWWVLELLNVRRERLPDMLSNIGEKFRAI